MLQAPAPRERCFLLRAWDCARAWTVTEDRLLLITRRRGKRIFLDIGGKRITIELAEISKSEARLAIDAPPECKIVREELTT
jgi:sRNA-binding carbon storage regulator CsrA